MKPQLTSWIASSLKRQFIVIITTGLTIVSVICFILFIGVYHEERDLVRIFGDRYRNYIQRTSRFIPWLSRKPTQDRRAIVDGA